LARHHFAQRGAMQISKKIVVILLTTTLVGCAVQHYHPAPVSIAKNAQSLSARTLQDNGLRAFLQSKLPANAGEWPLREWSLPELTLAAFYYSPSLQIVRDQVAEADAGIITARARPNPTIQGDLGGETAPESPWIVGAGFSLPIETAGKRRYRTTEAQQLADAARWNLASTGWSVRAQVRSALLQYQAANRSRHLLEEEERLRAEQVHLLEQRLLVGMIPRPEVDTARIQQTQALLAVQSAEGRISQARASLAAAIGVPVSALSNVSISWPNFDQPPSAESLKPTQIQDDAVLNRIDIRKALATYSAADTALRLEVALQYPNLDLGPNYAFEEGYHLFSIATSLVLPVFNRNQGPIAEAVARRRQAANLVLAVQAAGIASSEQALAKYTAALNQLSEARRLMQQSLAQQESANQAFKAGQSDRVALNGSQLQSAVTAIAELDAVVSAQQALGDLENAVQRPLLPGDIQPLSPQAPELESSRGKRP
jgi:cobalt-zinc-cadmium efflux system outer membrane protein